MRWNSASASDAYSQLPAANYVPDDEQSGIAENWRARWEGEERGRQGMALFEAVHDEYTEYIERIQDATGVTIDHPMTGFSNYEAFGQNAIATLGFGDIAQGPLIEFHKEVEALRKDNPGLNVLSRDDIMSRMRDQYQTDLETEREVTERASTAGAISGAVAGFARVMSDPLNAASMFVPALRASRGIIATATYEGALGAGAEALTIPGINKFREAVGEDPLTTGEMVGQVAIGAGAGAGLSATLSLLGRGAKATMAKLKSKGTKIEPEVEQAVAKYEEMLDLSPYMPNRQGDATHIARLDAAERYWQGGEYPTFREGVPDSVVVRAADASVATAQARFDASVTPEVTGRAFDDVTAGLLRQTDDAAVAAVRVPNIEVRMAGIDGKIRQAKVERSQLEGIISKGDFGSRDAVARFDRFMSEPAEIVAGEGGSMFRVRKVSEDADSKYLIARVSPSKTNKAVVEDTWLGTVADVENIRAGRPTGRPGEPVATFAQRGADPETQAVTGTVTSAPVRTGDAEAMEPLVISGRVDQGPRNPAEAKEASQQMADTDTQILNDFDARFADDMDTKVARTVTNEAGDSITTQVTVRELLDDFKKQEGALAEMQACALLI